MQPDENFWKKCESEQIANAYELEQLLGCGAFGGVFRAARIANGKKLEKRVAVKLMLSGTIQLEELNFALDLPSDPNLVQHHAGNNVEIRGFPMFYLVMELADCSLADFVKKRGGRISSVEAKAIVRDIAQGLKYLHELDAGNSQDKRYVHRDLKLLNVLQVGGVWKIADFGLSKALDRGTMQASKIAGTPYYMPPELFRNGYVSTKWDMWSLGVMIVEMLTGHFPFEAVYQDELERKIQRENPNLQDVPSEWLDIVNGCLTKDHEQRWAAIDVLKALESMDRAIPRPTIPNPPISSQRTQPVHVRPSSSDGFWGVVLPIVFLTGVCFLIAQIPRLTNYLPVISFPFTSKTATDFFNDGLIKAKSKDYKGAISDLNEAIRLKPDFALAYVGRGAVKYGLGDKQGAIADYNETIRLKSDYADAYAGRGLAKYDLGDKQGAITDYNEAIRLNPNDVDAYYNRGNAKSALGDKQGAIPDYNEAIRLKPDYADVYNNRGYAKYGSGDKETAYADYNEAIRLKPDLALAYINRGVAQYDLGDKKGAISEFNEAIRLKPDYAAGYYIRGAVKKERGEKQEALIDFRKAAELYQQQGNTEWYNKSLDRIKELGG